MINGAVVKDNGGELRWDLVLFGVLCWKHKTGFNLTIALTQAVINTYNNSLILLMQPYQPPYPLHCTHNPIPLILSLHMN